MGMIKQLALLEMLNLLQRITLDNTGIVTIYRSSKRKEPIRTTNTEEDSKTKVNQKL